MTHIYIFVSKPVVSTNILRFSTSLRERTAPHALARRAAHELHYEIRIRITAWNWHVKHTTEIVNVEIYDMGEHHYGFLAKTINEINTLTRE